MSSHFSAEKDCPAIKRATRSFVETLLAEMLPGMQIAARGCGYALAVHGSLARDIDLIAVPWTEHCDSPEYLVAQIKGAIAAQVGRALTTRDADDWTEKPHGRRALTIILAGMCPQIDLSIMPRIEKDPEE
jgi:hypothetical protein